MCKGGKDYNPVKMKDVGNEQSKRKCVRADVEGNGYSEVPGPSVRAPLPPVGAHHSRTLTATVDTIGPG